MGYQESLIYIQPQEQVGQIVKEYLMARQQDPSGRFLADIPAAVRLQAPLKGCPAGSVLLWAAGERSSDMLQAAMPDDWRLPGCKHSCRMRNPEREVGKSCFFLQIAS